MLDMRSLSNFPKVALNFLRNVSKLLRKGAWCSNKGANQTRVLPNNKMLMNPIWVGPIGNQWGWSRMTKHIWLTKFWNFEHAPSNLWGRQIHSSFGWGCIVEMHLKEVKTWLVSKWTTDSQNVWFSCSKFLRIVKTSSMDVDMIMNINKRWVIHNLS